MIGPDKLRCRVCEYPTRLDDGGRFISHAPPPDFGRCPGSGMAPEVYFRKLRSAVPGNRYEPGSTAGWAAYTRQGAFYVAGWSNGSGTAWWHTLASITYRQWREAVKRGIEF